MKKYQGVLERVKEIEYKRGIVYEKTSGNLYKKSKIAYLLFLIWTFIMNFMYVVGFMMYSDSEQMSLYKNSLITVSVCTALLILAYILTNLKLNVTGGIISTVSSVLTVLSVGNFLKDENGFLGYKISFYWRHLVPAVIMLLIIALLMFISVRERIKTDKLYKSVVNNLFEEYKRNHTGELSEQEWENFLKNYNHEEYKRSLKNNEQ
ncbi:MAG: hypothetical protein E7560_03030 [Ruminococcaceae bacterium]|nr:hypothetical protein [Oscillospiraceae bacterium]